MNSIDDVFYACLKIVTDLNYSNISIECREPWKKCEKCSIIGYNNIFIDNICKICLYDEREKNHEIKPIQLKPIQLKPININPIKPIPQAITFTPIFKQCNLCGQDYVANEVNSICVCQKCLDNANPRTLNKLLLLNSDESHCKTCKKNLKKLDFSSGCKMCIECTETDKKKKANKLIKK